jgi:hypothetical protein
MPRMGAFRVRRRIRPASRHRGRHGVTLLLTWVWQATLIVCMATVWCVLAVYALVTRPR